MQIYTAAEKPNRLRRALGYLALTPVLYHAPRGKFTRAEVDLLDGFSFIVVEDVLPDVRICTVRKYGLVVEWLCIAMHVDAHRARRAPTGQAGERSAGVRVTQLGERQDLRSVERRV